MQNNNLNINIDDLVKQIHTLYPHLACDEESNGKLRSKLCEQFFDAVPKVELIHQDLKCIILNVKKSLSEFRKRIDESVAQQELRRTTRVRKSVQQDPAVVSFYNNVSKHEKSSASTCTNTKCIHQMSKLSDLVQVESLPVSASTNLLTIFVPSILQEQLHSCKYKISIDLNRMDLTKKIIDLNLGQHSNPNLDTDRKDDAMKDEQECKITYEIKGNMVAEGTVELVEQNTNKTENNTKIEVKFSPNAADSLPSLEPKVSIVAEKVLPRTSVVKKGRAKRKEPKPPLNSPAKKRGRKLGSKNKKLDEKSEIAKYVEMFACTAGSPSAVSQVVTSTTQNWDAMPDQAGQIAYFMNGEWTLNGPSNAATQLVSTTNGNINLGETTVDGGQDNYIPFEDFVNFIDNPSLDAGNNVIARVLEGSVDQQPDNINTQVSQVMSMCVDDNPQLSKREEVALQPKPSTSKTVSDDNLNIVHSTVVSKKINGEGKAIDISKDYDISYNVNVLDLTQKKQNSTTSIPEANISDRAVVFSTSRSMPLLDDVEEHMFSSKSAQENESLEKRIVFSIGRSASPTTSNKNCSTGGSTTDSAIDIERGDIVDYSLSAQKVHKDKTKTDVMKGMSLLEIENNNDDSMLDFDNCLDDDLLSLAPSSCFNSPTDDRFGYSRLLDVDGSNTKASTFIDSSSNISSPAPKSNLELNFSKLKDDELNPFLKNFKIPRVINSRIIESPSKDPIKVVKEIQLNYQQDTPKISSGYPVDEPKPLHSFIPSIGSSLPSSSSAQITSTGDILKMFGSICYGFLADKCFETTCKFRHQLLELSVIITPLSLLRNDVLNSSYRFIWRHQKLFKFYFPIFCEEYARRNMRRKLLTMIHDCVMQPACLQYLHNIHSALTCGGLNRTNACRFILNRVKERTHVAIDNLLEIIIESDASMFTTSIEEFSNISSYKFRMTDINKMATTCLRSGSAELITVLIKCLICVDQTEFAKMRSPELIQLLEMIKGGGIDGL